MENSEALQKLYNDIENCIQNLKSLRIESSTYGYLLIPLLKGKILDELNMIILENFAEMSGHLKICVQKYIK